MFSLHKLRWLSATFVLLLLAAGCAGRPAAPAPETRPAPPAMRLVPHLTPVPGAFRELASQAGDALDATGLFFLKPATGAVEGWALKDVSVEYGVRYTATPDGRFVVAMEQEQHWIVDRLSGEAFRWSPSELELERRWLGDEFLTATANRLLFRDRQSQQLYVADGEMQVVATIDLPALGSDDRIHSLFSPDASQLAIVYGAKVYLVDPELGAVKEIGTAPPGQLVAVRNDVSAKRFLLFGKVDQYPNHEWTVRRFTWDGEQLDERRYVGLQVISSPDGRLMAVERWADSLSPGLLIIDAETGDQEMAVSSATTCFGDFGYTGNRWLAGGSGLVVRTRDGYRILTVPDGELQALPWDAAQHKGEPVPSPGRADLFAIGRTALYEGRTGQVLQVGVPAHPWHLDPWQAASHELRFSTVEAFGHDSICHPEMKLTAPVVSKAN